MRKHQLYRKDQIVQIVDGDTLFIIALFAAMLIYAVIAIPNKFYKPTTFISIAIQVPEIALLSLGMMLCMFSGGIDLSTVGIANLAAIICAKILSSNTSGGAAELVAIIAAMLVGTACGVFNGVLVGCVKMPAMLVTLSTLQVFTGLALAITRGPAITGISESFQQIGNGKLGGVVPYSLILLIAVTAIIIYLLNCTQYGIKLLMVGTNSTASKYSGINNKKTYITTYMISGLLAAMAGIVICSHYGSAKSDYGSSYTLQSLLIVVFAGTLTEGGSGKPINTVLSAVVFQIISTIFSILRISAFVKTAVFGAVLIATILIRILISRDAGRIKEILRKRDIQ